MILAKIDFDLMPECVDFEVYTTDIMRNHIEKYIKEKKSYHPEYLITMGTELLQWYKDELGGESAYNDNLTFMGIEVINDKEDNGLVFTLYDKSRYSTTERMFGNKISNYDINVILRNIKARLDKFEEQIGSMNGNNNIYKDLSNIDNRIAGLQAKVISKQ